MGVKIQEGRFCVWKGPAGTLKVPGTALNILNSRIFAVPPVGIEPTTFGL
jgi:hypothetical protein